MGVQADDEKGLAAERQREMRIVGIGADTIVPVLAQPDILVRQRLDAMPERAFEARFVEIVRPLEHHREAAEQRRVGSIIGGEMAQPVMDAQIVPAAGDVARADDVERAAGQRRLGPDTGKRVPLDMVAQQAFGLRGAAVGPWKQGVRSTVHVRSNVRCAWQFLDVRAGARQIVMHRSRSMFVSVA